MKILPLLLLMAALSPILAETPAPANPAPGSIAHFRFDGSARDEHVGNPPFNLANTEFQDNALHLNGKYEYGNEKGGYRAVCVTPKLDYNKFTVALRFKAEEFDEKHTTLFVGGTSHRWFRLTRAKDGKLILSLNNTGYFMKIADTVIAPEKWTVIACGVDVPARKVSVYLNGQKAATEDLPPGFQLKVPEPEAREHDRYWTFTDYSSSDTFKGLIDECIIYGEMLSEEAMAHIPLMADR